MKLNGFNNMPLSEAERHYLSHYQQGLLTR